MKTNSIPLLLASIAAFAMTMADYSQCYRRSHSRWSSPRVTTSDLTPKVGLDYEVAED